MSARMRKSILLVFFGIVIFSPFLFAEELSDKDIARQLQRQLGPQEEFLFYLKSGERMRGIKQEEGADYIKVKQFFGYSGSLTTKVFKNNIARLEKIKQGSFDIAQDEIRIKRELPTFNFSRSGAYSFFTDQDYFQIIKSIDLLQRLYGGFLSFFSPLIEKNLDRRIYVVIFGKPEGYYEYLRKAAPELKNAAGFYDSAKNQLVFYDFFNSAEYAAIDDFVKQENGKIRQLKEENRKYLNSDYDTYQSNLKKIQGYEQSLSAYMSRLALSVKEVNTRILRHEAAHQLSFDLIVNDGSDNFDSWLLEGLSEFASTPSLGDKNKEHLALFKEAIDKKEVIPLRELISYSMNNEFYMLEESKLALAYAQSWSLFYLLMQPGWKEKFFLYMLRLKAVRRGLDLDGRVKFLEVNLGVSLDDLQYRLTSFVKSN